MMVDHYSLKDQFLVAMPSMDQSVFAQSVTYICEHDDEGAMGLIINRPSGIALGEVLQQLNIQPNNQDLQQQMIYSGGPVQTDRGFILHAGGRKWDATLPLGSNMNLTTSKDILTSIAHEDGPEDCLVALGYAGWGAGQLEHEMANNLWINAPGDSDIIFRVACEDRLEAASSSLGIDLSRISSDAGHA